jgi:hypothetical protein
MGYQVVSIEDLVGAVCDFIDVDQFSSDNEIRFYTDRGVFVMKHFQECCENVFIKDIVGDLIDLINAPIITAEVRTEDVEDVGDIYYGPIHQWTFYEFATIKGSVTITWDGSSNGYYSVGVHIEKITRD